MNAPSKSFLEDDRLAAAMHRCGHAWRLAINEALIPLKLTHLQWAVIHLISDQPGLRQTELAEQMGIEAPSLVRVLDGLEAAGWVARKPCPDDRRAKRVFLQDSSEPRLEQAFATMRATHEKAVEGFSEEERRQLIRLIDAMSARLLEREKKS